VIRDKEWLGARDQRLETTQMLAVNTLGGAE
jgi:hypothetical protein